MRRMSGKEDLMRSYRAFACVIILLLVVSCAPKQSVKIEKSPALPTALPLLSPTELPEVDKHINQSGKLQDQWEFEEALEEAEKAIKVASNEDKCRAHARKAGVFIEIEEYDKAFEEIDKALKFNPNDGHTQAMKGTIYIAQGKFDLAKNQIEKVLEQNPKESFALSQYGDMYVEMGQPEKGLDYINKAIKENPESVYFKALRAKNLWKMNRIDDAIREYEEVVKLAPYRVESIEKLAHLYKATGRDKDALDLLDKHIRQNTGKTVLTRLLFAQMSYLDDGTAQGVSEALKAGEKLIQINPDYAPVYLQFAEIYEQQGELEKARENARMFLKKSPPPKRPFQYPNHAIAYRILGDCDKALEYCKKGTWGSTQYETYLEMARIYIQKKDYKSARKILNMLLEMKANPDKEDARALLTKIKGN